MKDTASHSWGTLHESAFLSSRLSGVRPLEGARAVLFGGPPTRTLVCSTVLVLLGSLCYMCVASRNVVLYGVCGGGEHFSFLLCAHTVSAVARMYTHNNIPTRPT